MLAATPCGAGDRRHSPPGLALRPRPRQRDRARSTSGLPARALDTTSPISTPSPNRTWACAATASAATTADAISPANFARMCSVPSRRNGCRSARAGNRIQTPCQMRMRRQLAVVGRRPDRMYPPTGRRKAARSVRIGGIPGTTTRLPRPAAGRIRCRANRAVATAGDTEPRPGTLPRQARWTRVGDVDSVRTLPLRRTQVVPDVPSGCGLSGSSWTGTFRASVRTLPASGAAETTTRLDHSGAVSKLRRPVTVTRFGELPCRGRSPCMAHGLLMPTMFRGRALGAPHSYLNPTTQEA